MRRTYLQIVFDIIFKLPFGERWEVYIVNGDYPGQWPKWYTTKTRWGAMAIVRRLNRSKFANVHGLVFGWRRKGAL